MKLKFNSILVRLARFAAAARLVAACLVAAGTAFGSPGATLEGEVVDASGAAVPNARVTLRREAVGFELSGRTDGEGRFRLEVPAEGVYELAAVSEGFSVSRRAVALRLAEGSAVRLILRPGVFSEEVTVLGTRVAGGPETLRRIPGSVDILLPEQIEAARVFTVSEALRKATGVNVRDEEGLGLRPNIGVRGLNPTRSTKVLLLEDGLPLAFAPYGDNATYYHPPIERFESVEVLKGAGQIAYGPVTVGGVVNYLTPGPPPEPAATVWLAGGNRDYFNGHAQGGGTWGKTGLLVGYMRKQGDGARDNVDSRLNDANLKLVYTPSASHSLVLKGSLYTEDSQVTYSGLRQSEWEADPRQNPFAHDAFDGRRLGASLRHAWIAGDEALLTTQLYASRFSRDWWRQSSNSGQRPNDASDPACGGMANLDTSCGNEGRLRDYDHLGIEPRLRLGHRLLGLRAEAEAGVRAHYEVQERRQENGDTPRARSGRLVEDNRRENNAYSAFLQERLLLGRLTLTPGLRFEHVDYERTNRLANSGAGVTGTQRVSQWVPGVGAAFAANEGIAFFAGVHRGFAPPRTEDVINNTTGGAVELDPELSWNYEAGARTQLRPGLGLDVTLFRIDYENQVVPASLAGGVGAALTNGGETLHQGLELGARLDTGALLGSPHNASLRLALTELPIARFEGTRVSNVPGFGSVSVGGNRLPYAPEHMLTAGVGYNHPSGASLFLEAVYVSDQFGDDLNSVGPSVDGQRGLIPAHTVWNATFNYELKPLGSTLFVTVKNLSDELYIADRSRGILPGSPRLVQAGVVARF
jgi:Fe(3+) dicitrate transport protein